MAKWRPNPVLYEINTAIWLSELGVTLGDVPEAEIARIASLGFDAVWMMGVWERSPGGRAIALSHPGLQEEYRRALPDFKPDDVIGSPYAIRRYAVDARFGGDAGLAAFRNRLDAAGQRLMLDFVPNHMAVDHEWTQTHPEFLMVLPNGGFAHGRDPNSPDWTDTVQIDYRRRETRAAMTGILQSIAERCDGVRCDMAMLVMRDVFCRTWGGAFDDPQAEFWPEAIAAIKRARPDFVMLAEAYWDLEYQLQQQGFDYTYDKEKLYNFLKRCDAGAVRAYLSGDPGYQQHMARFVENHDEGRCAQEFGGACQAVATAALGLPGLRLLYQGQMEGRHVKLPVQLGRRPAESPDAGTEVFYRALLDQLRAPLFHEGDWKPLGPQKTWALNGSSGNFVLYRWQREGEFVLVVANLSGDRAQCFVPLEWPELSGARWLLKDVLSPERWEREGHALLDPGLYLDVAGYGRQIFRFERM
jgi:glycosidase